MWYATTAPGDVTGYHTGSTNGSGSILIDQKAYTRGGHELAKTAIHEAAHDYGCEHDSIGQTPKMWEDFCVGDYSWGINSPPPPIKCPNMP